MSVVLGSVGLIFLLYKAVSLMYELESALNHIWAARNTKTPGRRFVDYLTVLLVGPLLILTATGITVSFMSTSFIVWLQKFEPFSTAILIAGELLPYVMAIAACTLVFAFLPNRKVGFFSALAGGVFAGVLWQFAGLAFAAFTVTSSQYSAIYSGFAFSILFPIRTMTIAGGRAAVQAGAGIVLDSDPLTEYQETLATARALLRVCAALGNP
jgi:membrane protein